MITGPGTTMMTNRVGTSILQCPVSRSLLPGRRDHPRRSGAISLSKAVLTGAMLVHFTGVLRRQMDNIYAQKKVENGRTLLDHTAVRAERPVLGLTGSEEPEIVVDELEARHGRGRETGATGQFLGQAILFAAVSQAYSTTRFT